MDERVHRRRRVRHTGQTSTAAQADPPGGPADSDPASVDIGEVTAGADWTGDPDQGETVERGLRGLIGGGSSQIKPAAAMRARDASRPRAEDLARAATELAIIRRHWVPRDAPRDVARDVPRGS